MYVLVSLKVHVIHLHSDVLHVVSQDVFDGGHEVVSTPVRVDDVVTVGPSPGLASIHQTGDGGAAVLGHQQGVRPPHGAVDIVREVGDIVNRCEDCSIHLLACHQTPGTDWHQATINGYFHLPQ